MDEEVKRVQAECRYLSMEIQRLREDNSKLRVGCSLLVIWISDAVYSVYTSLHQRWTLFPAFSNIWRSARAKDVNVNVNIRTSQFRRLRT